MAIGTHWEWRGFGSVSDTFFDRYGRLNYQFGPAQVEDLYIWAPNLQTNVKIREGADGGLKFKRLLARDGRLERWCEDPGDLFDFPMQEPAWHALTGELAKANLTLGAYPDKPPGRDQLLAILEKAGCETVLVSKEREGRWLQGPNGRVLVECAAIKSPHSILSISLESEEVAAGEGGLTDDQAKTGILAAIKALELNRERLAIMNYMDALALWTSGVMIN